MGALDSPPTITVPLDKDQLRALGLLADALDRYSLIGAIKRCDELVEQVRNVQLIHSQNLCRVANRLAFELEVERMPIPSDLSVGVPFTEEDDCDHEI